MPRDDKRKAERPGRKGKAGQKKQHGALRLQQGEADDVEMLRPKRRRPQAAEEPKSPKTTMLVGRAILAIVGIMYASHLDPSPLGQLPQSERR